MSRKRFLGRYTFRGNTYLLSYTEGDTYPLRACRLSIFGMESCLVGTVEGVSMYVIEAFEPELPPLLAAYKLATQRGYIKGN